MMSKKQKDIDIDGDAEEWNNQQKKVLSLVVLLFTNAQHVMLMMVELHLWDTIWTYASSLYCHTGCFISASVKVGKPFLNKRKQWFIYYPELCAIQNMKTVHKSQIFPKLDLLNLTDCSDLSFVRQWTAQVNSTQAPPPRAGRAVIWAITLIWVRWRDCSSLEEHWYRWFEILEMSFFCFFWIKYLRKNAVL